MLMFSSARSMFESNVSDKVMLSAIVCVDSKCDGVAVERERKSQDWKVFS